MLDRAQYLSQVERGWTLCPYTQLTATMAYPTCMTANRRLLVSLSA